MRPGEEFIDQIYGRNPSSGDDPTGAPSIVVLTNRRVLAHSKRLIRSVTVSWDAGQINAVGTGKGVAGDRLVFSLPGHDFILKKISRGTAEPFRRKVEQHLLRTPDPGPVQQPAPSASQRLAEISDLLASEPLSDQEYAQKRAEIIDVL
jgi:hypothetical protein